MRPQVVRLTFEFASAALVAVALFAAGGSAQTSAAAQTKVPVRTLTPVATSSELFGGILTVIQLPQGRVLVNDGGHRRLVVLDSSLKTTGVALDSVSGAANSYGTRPEALVPYLGDSSIFVDASSQELVMITPDGSVGRAVAPPVVRNFWLDIASSPGVDDRGRVMFRGTGLRRDRVNISMNGGAPATSSADSIPLLRADLETRRVDTIAVLQNLSARRVAEFTDPSGALTITSYVNPLQMGDEWTVLHDGAVAIIRGHDFHIDWITSDGNESSTGKLAFDWKRLSDEDKVRIRDSAAIALARIDSSNQARRLAATGGATGSAAAAVTGRGGAAGDPAVPAIRNVTSVIPVAEIPDYIPPIRPASVRADLDNNVWILPTTSAQSVAGELVYDVVNRQGVLVERVRAPLGASIVGFGRNHVAYLLIGDLRAGFRLQKARIT